MSEERLFKLESKIESHDKDLHSIAKSLNGINDQMERTNTILTEFAVKDERFNAKLDRVEQNLNAKIDANLDAIKRAHARTDKVDAIINKIAWGVVTFVAIGIATAVIKFG